jgi:3-phenylpropionate/trans-cinnamate dioxygenase ferredoxin reductase subunit
MVAGVSTSTSTITVAGGGLAAQRCCETLRARGHDGPIVLVCGEPHAPYDRPPLSKEWLAGEPVDPALRPAGWHAEHGVELLLGREARRLDPARRVLELDGGERLRYGRLVIATGGRPVALPEYEGFENVQPLRSLADATRLRDALAAGGSLAVIGAGLIGLEVAATARRLGLGVTVIEAGPAPLAPVLGHEAGNWLARMHREEGVDVRVRTTVAEVRAKTAPQRAGELVLSDGSRVACDHVVVGVGVRPATAWLAGSGLDPAGIAVDELGRSALPGVSAAGDAACRHDPLTGRLVPGAHWEGAVRGGIAAACGLLGLPAPAPAAPSFWSDQYGVRLQCVGDPRAADRVAFDGDPAGRCFELTYLRGGRTAAVLLAGKPPAALRAARGRLDVPTVNTDTRSAAA